jgi:DNA repair protein RadA/Sms
VDLAIVGAIASSFLDKAVPDRTVVVGEVGLTGEVRAIGQAEQRILEARKMGFNRCILPQGNLKRLPEVESIQLVGVRSVPEAVEALF